MLFFKKDRRGYNLRDEATRELALEKRRMNRELEKARQELEIEKLRQKAEIEQLKLERQKLQLEKEIRELSEEDDDEEDLDTEKSLQYSLLNKLIGNFTQSQNNNLINPQEYYAQQETFQGVELNDETINKALDSVPKSVLKKFKKFSDEELSELIKTRLGPYATEATISRMIKRYRERFK